MTDKKEALKDIIRALHEGLPIDAAKARVQREVGPIETAELVAIEQSLIEEGLPPQEIAQFCNVHVALVQDALTPGGQDSAAEPTAVIALKKENREIQLIVDAIRDLASTAGEGALNPFVEAAQKALLELGIVDRHYQLKENLLFPYLERHGFPGPSQVMWEKDNQVRGMLKTAREVFAEIEDSQRLGDAVQQAVTPLLEEVQGMITKEEDILFPACIERLDSDEWARIGIEMEELSLGDASSRGPTPGEGYSTLLPEGTIRLPSGTLGIRELVALFGVLPFDITFVDAEDRVRYFSEGQKRIFLRTRAVLGRKVQNCHPPYSMAAVQKILDEFRSGEADSHDFWIRMKGRLILIRYFAVRDPKGDFLGTLEVTQDVTDIQTLEGEKRLVE